MQKSIYDNIDCLYQFAQMAEARSEDATVVRNYLRAIGYDIIATKGTVNDVCMALIDHAAKVQRESYPTHDAGHVDRMITSDLVRTAKARTPTTDGKDPDDNG